MVSREMRDNTYCWTITEDEIMNAHLLKSPISQQTITFKRFPNLSVPGDELDILVKSLLGILEPVNNIGYKFRMTKCITNDSWTVNLIKRKEENIMLDSFLKGFSGCEELKKQWGDKHVIGVNVSEELKDLLKVYIDAEDHLRKKEEDALNSLSYQMKKFLEVQEEHKKISDKLKALVNKMKSVSQEPCDECDEGNEEDDE